VIKQSRTISRVAVRACAALVLVVLAACPGGGGGGTGPDTRVTQVVVTAPSLSVEAGAALQLSASARNAAGASVGGSFTWTSSNSAVAVVAANGEVQGAAPGTATITATETGSRVAGSLGVTVVPAAVQSVVVDPASASVQLGRTQNLTATLRDARGAVLTGRAVAWTTSNPGIATVNGAGVVTATGLGGPVTITANAEGRNGTAQITVVPVPIATLAITPAGPHTLTQGASLTLNAVARDAAGNALTGRALSWTSADPAVVSVSATGVVTAASAGGPVAVTATSEGVSASAQVTVTPAPVASVSVSPSQDTVMLRETVQFAAVARDAGGSQLTGRAVTWTTSDPVLATVSASGLVTGQSVGQVTVTATVEGRTGTAQVTVIPRTAASVTLNPRFVALSVGGTRSLDVSAADAGGVGIPSPVVTWASSSSATASVNATGLVSGAGIGTARVTARVNNASDTTYVAVLGSTSLLSTAFPNGLVRAEVRPGSLISVPVMLDMSRPSAAGDLGSVQFQLGYDPAVLTYQSALPAVTGSAETYSPQPGVVRFAFAATSPQSQSSLTLVTLTFQVAAGAPVGTQSPLNLTYTAAPTGTAFQIFSLPLVVSGRVRIVAP
jgi:uncharacterized protein YjdB